MMQWALDMLYLIQQLREDWGESGIFIMNLISEYGLYNFILMLFPTAIYPLIFHKISWLGGGQEPPRDQS